MKNWLIVILGLTISCSCFAQQKDTILSRIVLIGDGGALINGQQPVVQAIKNKVPLNAKTTILYLGDNIYKIGLPDDSYVGYNEARVVLDSQVSIVRGTATKVYMIPGNHDWNNGGPGGYDAILREQLYVDLLDSKNVKFFPEAGCPGPVEIAVNDEVVIVAMDSQWWLHPYDKPGVESDCPYKTKDEVLAQLQDILTKNYKKLVILATHHPFRTYGTHGGYYGFKQHVFPFTDLRPNLFIPMPVIGSIYPISRGVFGNIQDLKHPIYQNMIRDIEQVTKNHPNLIYASGHEHSLQLIKDTGQYYVVSGSAYNSTRVSKSKRTLFATPEHGYAVLEVSTNKNVNITFYTTGPDSTKEAYTTNLLNFSKLPELPKDTTKPVAEWKDNVLVAASSKYKNASAGKKLILGKNYRRDWGTPVAMKMFNIQKEKGGFKILSLGGGKQTKSLKLIDKNGREWALRTIDKDPEKAIPENLRNSIAQDIVQDLISAANPYAPLTVPTLAKATGVVQATPEVFFVPDDPAFGYYRPLFANTVCFLEEKEPIPTGVETKSTQKVLDKMVEDNDHLVDQKAVLRARLLDIMIADYDRHFDQWRFSESDTGKGKIYTVIPKDRDQAYFYSDGLFMKYITRNRLPFLKGLRYNIPRINWLGFTSRDFDRIFLNQLDASAWNEVIVQFQKDFTDSAVWEAMRKYPPEIYPIHGETIGKKLISRRAYLQKQGMRYYRFISKYVNIIGSNKPEYFKITGTDSGLLVRVYAMTEKSDTSFKMYERSFVSRITKELRLYGLNGNDVFDVDPSADGKMRLRIIGGKGNDSFSVKGSVANYIYDYTAEQNSLSAGRRTRNFFSPDVHVNDYERIEFKYKQSRFPKLNIGYNQEDGFFFGPGLWRRTYGFRKEPFATDQRLATFFAVNRGAYQINYSGVFNHVIRNKDLLINAQIVNPVLNNFYGLGNNTEQKKDVPIEFYRVRYRFMEADILVRKRTFGGMVSYYAGPTLFHYWNRYEDNNDKILGQPSLVQLDSLSVYTNKTYLGGKLGIDLNNLNNEMFPTRGITWNTQFSFLAGMTDKSGALTKITSDMVVYASMAQPANTVMILKVGGGHIFNKKFEYFQALNLGANNFLRGFRKNRFSGNSLFYTSLEVRQKLFNSKWYIIPGEFGLVGFGDMGRVWYHGESSKRWHTAFGGGCYYVPFNMVIVSATVGFSEEQRLFNFSIATKLNLTF